jgi:hypothetical protein
MVRFLKNYSLSLVLGVLFLFSWLLHGLTGWKAFVSEQKVHGASAAVWGDDGYVWEFLKQTLENWQSEFLQLLSMVVLTLFSFIRAAPNPGIRLTAWNAKLTRSSALLSAPSNGVQPHLCWFILSFLGKKHHLAR